MKVHGGCGCKGPYISYTATTLEEVGWLVLRSAAFTSGESPRYSFYRRLMERRTSLDTKDEEKFSPLPTPGIEPGPSIP